MVTQHSDRLLMLHSTRCLPASQRTHRVCLSGLNHGTKTCITLPGWALILNGRNNNYTCLPCLTGFWWRLPKQQIWTHCKHKALIFFCILFLCFYLWIFLGIFLLLFLLTSFYLRFSQLSPSLSLSSTHTFQFLNKFFPASEPAQVLLVLAGPFLTLLSFISQLKCHWFRCLQWPTIQISSPIKLAHNALYSTALITIHNYIVVCVTICFMWSSERLPDTSGHRLRLFCHGILHIVAFQYRLNKLIKKSSDYIIQVKNWITCSNRLFQSMRIHIKFDTSVK